MWTVSDRTVERMAWNVGQVLGLATADEWTAGVEWYQDGCAIAAQLADEYGVNVDQVVGVIAALSPQCEWSENLRRARELLATGDVTGAPRVFVESAQRIAAGLVWARAGVAVNGPKVWSFFDNLADPLGSDEVTVDRHALSVALGRVVEKAEAKRLLERAGVYELVGEAYRRAAERAGLRAHECQAVAWVVWRQLAPTAPARRAVLVALRRGVAA